MRRLAVTTATLAAVSAAARLALAQDTAPPAKPLPPTAAPASASVPGPGPVQPSAAPAEPEKDADEPRPPAPRPAAPPAPEAPRPPPTPLKRPRFTAAVMQGVDKITAETLRFEAKVGEPVRYKGLILTVRACETNAADEPTPDSIAYVDVQSQPELLPGRAAAPPRRVFQGWMFASSPTLHPLEHPVYDLWLIACKAATPGT